MKINRAEIRKIMYTPGNPSFTIKSGVQGGLHYRGSLWFIGRRGASWDKTLVCSVTDESISYNIMNITAKIELPTTIPVHLNR